MNIFKIATLYQLQKYKNPTHIATLYHLRNIRVL